MCVVTNLSAPSRLLLSLFLLFLVRSLQQLNLNDIGRNSLLGNRKKIAKFLMRTFTCRSTFLYELRHERRIYRGNPWAEPQNFFPKLFFLHWSMYHTEMALYDVASQLKRQYLLNVSQCQDYRIWV
jgi:hypothetical protein